MIATNRLMASALLVLALTGAAGMFWVGGKLADISDRVHPGAIEEQRRLQVQLQIDAQVEEALGGLGDDIAADRTLVWLAHNGTTDLTGRIPFMFVSNAHAWMRPGLAWEERWSRPVPLSAVSQTLRRMFRDPERPRCVRIDRGDADLTPVARSRMVDRGIELTLICPLQGPRGIVGMVSAEYLRRDSMAMPADQVLGRVGDTTRHIHAALTSGG